MASVDTKEFGVDNEAQEPRDTYQEGYECSPFRPFVHDTTLADADVSPVIQTQSDSRG